MGRTERYSPDLNQTRKMVLGAHPLIADASLNAERSADGDNADS